MVQKHTRGIPWPKSLHEPLGPMTALNVTYYVQVNAIDPAGGVSNALRQTLGSRLSRPYVIEPSRVIVLGRANMSCVYACRAHWSRRLGSCPFFFFFFFRTSVQVKLFSSLPLELPELCFERTRQSSRNATPGSRGPDVDSKQRFYKHRLLGCQFESSFISVPSCLQLQVQFRSQFCVNAGVSF